MKSHCADPHLRGSRWFWEQRAEENMNEENKGVFLHQNLDYVNWFSAKQKDILSQYITKDKKVLDLGCGNGRMAQYLAFISKSYVGVDFCQRFIDNARKDNPQLKFILADARDRLPFKDREFDICVIISCFTSIEANYLQIIAEAKRVARDVLLVEEDWMAWYWETPLIVNASNLKWSSDVDISEKVGIVGYANYQGLGIMIQDFRKQLGIKKQLVIPSSDKGTFPEFAPDCHVCKDWIPTEEEIRNFLADVGTVITIETPFSSILFRIAKEMGKKTVFFPMWEWFDPQETHIFDYVDNFICISKKCYEAIPYKNKHFIPYPLDTEYFPHREITGKAKIFIHNAGYGGLNGRKGTNEVVNAFNRVKGNIELILRTQKPIKEYPCYKQAISDNRIKIIEGNISERRDLYVEGDVLIATHHYDGQCLVVEEGMACGLPVITTNAPPMNEFTDDKTLMVKVGSQAKVNCKHPEVYAQIPDVDDLAEKIRWCMNNDLMEISRTNRRIIEKDYSWHILRNIYKRLILGESI